MPLMISYQASKSQIHLRLTASFSKTFAISSINIEKRLSPMPINNIAIRNHKNTPTKDQRMFFVLENDLKQELREVAQANYVSESQFVRESVRRNITAYKKALSR